MSICNLDHFAEAYWEPRRHVLVGGAFDPLHEGHLAYFEEARRLGPLVCAVSPDPTVAAKGKTPCLPELTRLKVLNACSLVEHVTLAADKAAVIRALQPVAYVVGMDHVESLPDDERAACEDVGTRIVFVDCREASSSDLLADYERRRTTEKLAAFERFVQGQTPAKEPWVPVTDYSFEARAEAEGDHPFLIRDVFQPRKLLDVGCGHGYLLRMLAFLGICGDGMDVQRLGPFALPGGFYTRSISDPELYMERDHDLVICREVLEHLTVKQIAIAVRNLVKLSSKFVYVTTRFTAKSALLDVDGSDDLDPTHISLLHQDFLRSLFVLEGCTRRADLEAKLDWQHKSRVLVYEVPA